MTPPARRTNVERSAQTQAMLLRGAEECLIDVGYAKTTTSEVCRRAGVSNGSLLHHYGTRTRLLAATLANIYNRFATQIEQATDGLDPQPAVFDAFLDQLFAIFDSDAMKAMIELWLASANDAALREQVYPVMIEFADEITPRAARLLPGLRTDSPELARTMRFILVTLQGYALSLIAFGRDQPGEEDVRAFLRAQVRLLLSDLGVEQGAPRKP